MEMMHRSLPRWPKSQRLGLLLRQTAVSNCSEVPLAGTLPTVFNEMRTFAQGGITLFLFYVSCERFGKTPGWNGCSCNRSKSIPEMRLRVPNWYVAQNMTVASRIALYGRRIIPKWIGLVVIKI
jgi:hypothetical protein